MRLNEYITLGRSGLRVSPLTLGTMTFGTEWGWGSEEETARSIFERYLEAGGNFIDTADGYTGGKSEEMVGKFVAEGHHRDRVVIATKFTFNAEPGDPNAGGNGRKNVYRALEGSLHRLKTDYVDLYWLHAWDTVTPVEEVVSTLNDMVRQGKIRYYGFSDTPAWYLSRAQTIAEKEGKERLIALQLEYSLVERNIEREHIPAAQELGLGICPWSPLAGGFLTGKYERVGTGGGGDGRLEKVKDSGNPVFKKFTERNWKILDVLLQVSKQINRTPAQVALNWAATQPGITSSIIGASKIAQLEDNLAAIEFSIPAEPRQRLDDVSALEGVHPYMFFEPFIQGMISGGTIVRPWAPKRLYLEPLASASTVATGKESGPGKLSQVTLPQPQSKTA
jgi:aryl-alcohol dehydrogenase-like predicted oxidoreductase